MRQLDKIAKEHFLTTLLCANLLEKQYRGISQYLAVTGSYGMVIHVGMPMERKLKDVDFRVYCSYKTWCDIVASINDITETQSWTGDNKKVIGVKLGDMVVDLFWYDITNRQQEFDAMQTVVYGANPLKILSLTEIMEAKRDLGMLNKRHKKKYRQDRDWLMRVNS